MTSSYADLTTGRYVVLVNDNARADQIAPNEISHCHPALEITEVYRQQGFVVYSISLGTLCGRLAWCAAASPFASEPEFQALREHKKVNAGAQFFQTNLLYHIQGMAAANAASRRNWGATAITRCRGPRCCGQIFPEAWNQIVPVSHDGRVRRTYAELRISLESAAELFHRPASCRKAGCLARDFWECKVQTGQDE